MYINKDESITVQLKDYDRLLSVLSKHNYWDSYYIKECYNKHKGLTKLLMHGEVLDFIRNFNKTNSTLINTIDSKHAYTIILYKELRIKSFEPIYQV